METRAGLLTEDGQERPSCQLGPGSVTVPVSGGAFSATVDESDAELVLRYHWQALKCPSGRIYAKRELPRENGKKRCQLMHVLITGNAETDHRNRDGLDNRRINLRPCTRSQNLANRGKVTPNGKSSSRFKGVGWHAQRGYWVARAKRRHIGVFESEIDAARAYDKAAKELFGEFALTNEDLGLYD